PSSLAYAPRASEKIRRKLPGGGFNFLAVVTHAGNKLFHLVDTEAVLLRDIADLIILVTSNTTAVGLPNFGLIIGHGAFSYCLEKKPLVAMRVPLCSSCQD